MRTPLAEFGGPATVRAVAIPSREGVARGAPAGPRGRRTEALGRWRGTRAWRGLGYVLLALQGVLWGVGPIAEARADAVAVSVVAHVEAAGATSCPPAHSSHECQVGRTLGAGAITSQGAPAVPAPREVSGPSSIDEARADRGESSGALGSRAPPSPV